MWSNLGYIYFDIFKAFKLNDVKPNIWPTVFKELTSLTELREHVLAGINEGMQVISHSV